MLGASRASSTREYQVIDVSNAQQDDSFIDGNWSYHVVPGTVYIVMELFGSGGAGGHGDSTGMFAGQAGQGGGSGGYVRHKYASDDLKPNDIIKFSVGETTTSSSCISLRGGCDGESTYPYRHYESDGITEKYIFHEITAGGGHGGINGGDIDLEHTWGTGGKASGGNEENIEGGIAGPRPGDGMYTGTGSNGGDAPMQVEGGLSYGGLGGAGGTGATSGGNGGIAAGGGGGGGFGTVTAPPFSGGHGAMGNVIIKAYG